MDDKYKSLPLIVREQIFVNILKAYSSYGGVAEETLEDDAVELMETALVLGLDEKGSEKDGPEKDGA